VLCHAAVRARAMGVPLVACLDERERARARALAEAGATVALRLRGEAVELSEVAESEAAVPEAAAAPPAQAVAARRPSAAAPAEGESGAAGLAAAVPAGAAPAAWVLAGGALATGAVGAKSANTRRLDAALPAWLRRPASAALPLGALEAVLVDPINAEVSRGMRKLEGQLGAGDGAREQQLLADIR
jgi:hypothetical protein